MHLTPPPMSVHDTPRIRRRYLIGLASILIAGVACSDPSSPADVGAVRPADAGPSSVSVSVAVEPQTLNLSPGESRTLTITVSPPGEYDLIIYLEGDSTANAFVDTASFTTQVSDGGLTSAEVEVVVAGRSDDFSVNIVINGQRTEVPVKVGSDPRADMRVVPDYDGLREVQEWTVNTKHGGACEDTTGLSEPKVSTYNPTQPSSGIDIEQILANEPVTIYVRSRRNVVGCRRNVLVEPGRLNAVVVEMTSLPLRLSSLSFPLVLGLARNAALDDALFSLRRRMLSQFGSQQSVLDALLETMARTSGQCEAQLSCGDANTFDFARYSAEQDWPGLLATQFGSNALDRALSQEFEALLREASHRLHRQDLFLGELTGADNTSATLTLFQIDDHSLGEPETHAVALETVNVGFEGLRLGFEIPWHPARLLIARAEELARSNHLSETDEAIATALQVGAFRCEHIAETLAFDLTADCYATDPAAASQSDPSQTMGRVACLQRSCNAALLRMWSRAALDIPGSTLSVTVTGRVDVGDEPEPIGLSPVSMATPITSEIGSASEQPRHPWVGQAIIQAEDAFPVSVFGQFSTVAP